MPQRLSIDPVSGHQLLSPSPTCMNMLQEPECGHCVYIVSGKESFIGEKEGHWLNGNKWSVIRQTAVYLPARESYAPLATYMDNSCQKMGCNDDLTRFKVKLGGLSTISKATSK